MSRFDQLIEEYKKNDSYSSCENFFEEVLSVDEARRFVIPEPKSIIRYISEINYDTDYIISIGGHQLVMLNSGWDTDIPDFDDLLQDEAGIDDLSRPQKMAFNEHPYSRGFIPQHLELVKEGRRLAGKNGLVLLFTHAPLYNHKDIALLKGQMEEQSFKFGPTRSSLKDIPIETQITYEGIKNSLENVNVNILESYKNISVDHFDYDLNEGSFVLLGKDGKMIDACFEGHTHGSWAKRLKLEYESGGYSGKKREYKGDIYHVEWIFGNEDYYQSKFGSDKNWFINSTPFFFNSGALKSRLPMCREIKVNKLNLEKAKLNRNIPRKSQKFTSGPMTSFLTAAIAHFYGVSGFNGMMFRNDPKIDLMELWLNNREIDRDLVMWDMVSHFRESLSVLRMTLLYSGYANQYGDGYKGFCKFNDNVEIPNLSDWDYKANMLLECYNIPLSDTDMSKISKQKKLQEIALKIQINLKKICGWLKYGIDQTPSWYEDSKNFPERKIWADCRQVRLLEASIWSWLDSFGYYPNSKRSYSFDIYNNFRNIDPNIIDRSQVFLLSKEREQRIVDMFDFSKVDPFNSLRLWYASESLFLAHLGGYKQSSRNVLDPAYHLTWAKSTSLEVLKAELLDKYKIQILNQFNINGIEGLRRFYCDVSAKLAGWGANGLTYLVEDYHNETQSMSDQQMLISICEKVEDVINLLIN